MELNKRSKKIFELLRDHSHGITGKKIAEQLGVSSRTIRSDIKILQEAIHDVKIISAPNWGYRLSSLENIDNVYKWNNNDTIIKNRRDACRTIYCCGKGELSI